MICNIVTQTDQQSWTKQELEEYERALMREWDDKGKIEFAEKKGIEIGIEKGIEIGIEKGIDIGIEKGKDVGIDIGKEESKRETAITAIKEGLGNTLISKLTGLTESHIDQLREELHNQTTP